MERERYNISDTEGTISALSTLARGFVDIGPYSGAVDLLVMRLASISSLENVRSTSNEIQGPRAAEPKVASALKSEFDIW